MVDLSQFEQKTKIIFKDKKLLEQAFIHRSYINENTGLKLSHNERLEFLGDAVLELIVTDHLYKKYPDRDEGELTAYRSALVNAVIIGEVAQDLGIVVEFRVRRLGEYSFIKIKDNKNHKHLNATTSK
jgi:ribonuclease-3